MRWKQLTLIATWGAIGAILWFSGCEYVVYNDFPAGLGWGVDAGPGQGGSTSTGGSGGTGTGGSGEGLACCSACHGTEDNPAPPPDYAGKTDPSLATVGAHQTHVADTMAHWHKVIDCIVCHTSPTTCVEKQEGVHLNDERDVIFNGPLVSSAVYDSTTDPNKPTCQNVWCHGAFLGDSQDGVPSYREPVWTESDLGIYNVCGKACHSLPPKTIGHSGEDHPVQTPVPCEGCHYEVIEAFDAVEPILSTWADPTKHVNGDVEVDYTPGTGGAGGAGGGAGGG